MNIARNLAFFIAGLLVAAAVNSIAGDDGAVRFEGVAGISQHRRAPEGSWWYSGFETDMDLRSKGYSVGLAWLPIKRGAYRFGGRIGFADLGMISAHNAFPIFEDGSSNDARVNPNCDRSTLSGCTGKYDGSGWAHGFYFGPAVERRFGEAVLGAEAGVFYYRSAWIATNWRAVDSGGEFIPAVWQGLRWDDASGNHSSLYFGANARWHWLYVSGRYYAQVRAARTDKGPAYIGPTKGPLWSLMIGLSIPLGGAP